MFPLDDKRPTKGRPPEDVKTPRRASPICSETLAGAVVNLPTGGQTLRPVRPRAVGNAA
jgi:hypothetical protein